MRREFLPGYLFATLAALSYAGGQVLSRYVVQEVAAPLVSSALGLLFGTFFLFLFALPRLRHEVKEVKIASSSRGIFFFAASGLAAGVGMTALMYGMSYSQVAVVSSVSATMPLFALLFTHLFLGLFARHPTDINLPKQLAMLRIVTMPIDTGPSAV